MSLALLLRRATAQAHQALEDSLDLLRDDFTLADYVELLRGFDGFIGPWEAAVAASGHVDAAELASRRHAERLAADLAHFGVAGAPPRRAGRGDLPALDSPGAVLGSRYVVEGSTLGGRVIAPRLQQRFGVDASRGAAYFGGYGERTGAMWRAFGAQLAAAPPHWHADAVDGALQTFGALQRWLCERRPVAA